MNDTVPGGGRVGPAPNCVAHLHWQACRADAGTCVEPIEFEVQLFEGQRRFDISYAGAQGG